MEELVSLAAIIPIVGAVVAVAGAVASVVARSTAEKKFIHDLSEEILKAVQSEVHQKSAGQEKELAEVYRQIYFEVVRNRAKNKAFPTYITEALSGLDRKEKAVIVSALKQPSVSGRMRYIDKVFKEAVVLLKNFV